MADDPNTGHTGHALAVTRRARWLKPVLFASLALNLLVLGALASATWRYRSPEMAALQFGPGNIVSYVGDLPAERRAVLWKQTTEPRRALGPLRRAVRAARRDAFATLSAEPFQPQRYIEAQSRVIDAERVQRLAAAKLFAEVASTLTADERRGFIRWREKRLPPNQRGDGPDTDRDADSKSEPKPK